MTSETSTGPERETATQFIQLLLWAVLVMPCLGVCYFAYGWPFADGVWPEERAVSEFRQAGVPLLACPAVLCQLPLSGRVPLAVSPTLLDKPAVPHDYYHDRLS